MLEIHFKNDVIYGLIRYLSVDRVVIVCNKKKKEKKNAEKKMCVCAGCDRAYELLGMTVN